MAWALSNFNSTQVDQDCDPLFGTFLRTVQSSLSIPARSSVGGNFDQCGGTISSSSSSSNRSRDSSVADTEQKGKCAERSNKSHWNTVNSRNRHDRCEQDCAVSSEWPFSNQCFMACVSVICCMYSESESVKNSSRNVKCGRRERNTENFFSKDSRMYERSFELFQICARLPQNTHAISRVKMVEHTGDAREIIQERAGFGLFLAGSAVNHSCVPNCSVRFHFNEVIKEEIYEFNDRDETNKNNNKIKNKNIMKILENVRLEIVSTRIIPEKTECCISYGPLKGKHNTQTRKNLLEKQYLFSCNCPACSDSICEEENKVQEKSCKIIASQGSKDKLNRLGNGSGPRISSEESKFLQQNKRDIDDFSAQKQQNDVMSDLIQLNSCLPKFRNTLNEIKSKMREFSVNLSSDSEKNRNILKNFDHENILPLRNSLRELNDKCFTERKWSDIRKAGKCGTMIDNRVSSTNEHRKSEMDGNASRKQLKIFEGMYAEYCSVFCETYDISAHIASLSGKYRDACLFVQDSISGMTDSRSLASYAEDDVAVARERVKLAQCMLRAGDRTEWYVTFAHDSFP
jgi:SET domain